MNRILVAAIALTLTTAASAEEIRGTWAASSEKSGSLYVSLTRRHNQNGQTHALSAFEGLTDAQLNAAAQTPVQFRLQREAGTVHFEGLFKQREGAGHFTFAPNLQFLQTLRSLGVEHVAPASAGDLPRKGKHRKSDEESLFALALHDVSSDFIRSMQAEGYRVGLDEYVSMRIFNVSPALIAELRQLGYDKIPHDDLIASQIHKATPAFIRQLRALGYTNLSMDDLVAFRIHRVSAEFIEELSTLGYRDIAADDLVAMRIHRVTPEFIREMREAGYTNVPVEKLISMRIHGLDAIFAKKMNSSK
jgi:hypothetical protein